jgi:tripartite-type tricarboxylate transporter receptor subunit TctC
MIVPFPPGGGTDFVGRLVAKYLSQQLGQTIFVENHGGANGTIGLQALMKSAPDGYAGYCNNIRTHRSLNKDAPVSRPVQRTGFISSRPILGGLHHHYVRI